MFGPSGDGWKYETVRLWNEPGPGGEVFAFAEGRLYIRLDSGDWSDPIPGVGGSMLVATEKGSLRANDEGYKMADTDAFSVCCKRLGFGADVYAGRWDGSKYNEPINAQQLPRLSPENPFGEGEIDLSEFDSRPRTRAFLTAWKGRKGVNEWRDVFRRAYEKGWTEDQFVSWALKKGVDLANGAKAADAVTLHALLLKEVAA
jgi:hypothetical protein